MAETTATTEAPGTPEVEHEMTAFGINPAGFVALSMIVVILLLLWKKVPSIIGAGLDSKIAHIRKNLDEAAQLRIEAEALKAEFEAKAKAAAGEADGIVAHAKSEADQILARAKTDAAALIERRGRMAEDKIAAAERTALAEVRAKVASAAAEAAATIIAEKNDAATDRMLVDQAISSIGSARLN
jgi:F-type H+-transporting ATPase subunit b